MAGSLKALYSQALEYSSRALKLERRLAGRVAALASRNDKTGTAAQSAIRLQHLLLNRVNPALVAMLESVATPVDKEDPFFPVVISEFPLESLAEGMLQELSLTRRQVDCLLQLHELKRPSLADVRIGVTAPWGASIFALGFLLKTVPADLFRYYHANSAYVQYEVVVCIVWAVLPFVIVLRGLQVWIPYQRAKREYDRLGTLLGYCKLLRESEDTQCVKRRNRAAAAALDRAADGCDATIVGVPRSAARTG